MEISYSDFVQEFTPEHDAENNEIFRATSLELGSRTVRIGFYHEKRVALKEGDGLNEEINIHKRLNHPNVVKYIATITFAKNNYLLMEGIDNCTNLHDYCREYAPIFRDTTISMIKQIAGGINYLHSMNVIHHDLKPENILVEYNESSNPRVKICDFGHAEITNKNGHGSSKMREAGTFFHLAPEQLYHNIDLLESPITNKIDVYSFSNISGLILCSKRNFDDVLSTFPPEMLTILLYDCRARNPNIRPRMVDIVILLSKF